VAEHRTALFWGDDPYVLLSAAHELLEAAGVRATEIQADEWRGGETSDLATPSLFGERRALLIRECQALPAESARELRDYLASPSPDALCLLTHVTKGKSAPPLAKAVEAGGGLVKQVSLKRQELPRWVLERAAARGLAIRPPAAGELISVLGEDPATLDQAVEQLAGAFGGAEVGVGEVRSQFEGIGEAQVWDLCDQAFAGRAGEALVTLRSLLERRNDPLLILGSIASRVRDLLRVRSLPERMPAAEAARAAGLRFDWQLRRYREQSRRFTADQLAEVHTRVVEADRAIKGGAPGDLVLAALVSVMAGEPAAALDLPMRVSR
jgi:DNA polymerase-3 subunit delta